MMRVDTRPRKRNAPRPAEKSALGYLQWIRGRECVFAGSFRGGECGGKIEAMHLDFAGGKGVATKVADRFCLPGCSAHHKRQTDRGWVTFLREVGFTKEDLLDGADMLWRLWPGRPKWEDRNGA